MGELFLVLVLTCVICVGTPLLAFGYIHGKIKFSNRGTADTEQSNRRVLRWMILILGTFFGCFMFPVYNFTRNDDNNIRWYGLFSIIFVCWAMGVISARAFPYKRASAVKTVFTLLGFSCIHIFAGMGCRYLLQFGEVSNAYNFTVPNMVVHLLAVNAFCLASWYFGVKYNLNKNQQV